MRYGILPLLAIFATFQANASDKDIPLDKLTNSYGALVAYMELGHSVFTNCLGYQQYSPFKGVKLESVYADWKKRHSYQQELQLRVEKLITSSLKNQDKNNFEKMILSERARIARNISDEIRTNPIACLSHLMNFQNEFKNFHEAKKIDYLILKNSIR